jgi:hypothetical protein
MTDEEDPFKKGISMAGFTWPSVMEDKKPPAEERMKQILDEKATEDEENSPALIKSIAFVVCLMVAAGLFAYFVGYYKGNQDNNFYLCKYHLRDVVGPNVLDELTWTYSVNGTWNNSLLGFFWQNFTSFNGSG